MADSTSTGAPAAVAGKAARIAVVGAYGSGKTLLSTALSRLTGIPRAPLYPMDRPVGPPEPGRTIADCTPAELVQLTVRRYTERVVEEGRLAGGFVSDGSAIHEWTYAKTRLVAGSFPRRPDPLAAWERDARTVPYEEVVDQLGLLMLQHCARSYDVFVRLPVEFPLAPDNRPVNENFRLISDDLLDSALRRLDPPVLLAAGSAARRLETLVAALGLDPVMTVEEALRPPDSPE